MDRENPDEFEDVLDELSLLAEELQPQYDRYNDIEALLAARAQQIKLSV